MVLNKVQLLESKRKKPLFINSVLLLKIIVWVWGNTLENDFEFNKIFLLGEILKEHFIMVLIWTEMRHAQPMIFDNRTKLIN